jgi:soluble lytic murein transglycosylase
MARAFQLSHTPLTSRAFDRFLVSAVFLASLGASALAQTGADSLLASSIAAPAVAGQRVPEMSAFKAATDAYRRGDVAGGDAAAQRLADPTARVAAEWVALRAAGRSLGFERVNRFMTANPEFPMQRWLQRRAEDSLLIERARPERVLTFFRDRQPEGPSGRAALAVALQARALNAQDRAEAERVALSAYRDRAVSRDVAELLERSFPERIGAAERLLRAHRLILTTGKAEGLRLAEGHGPDHAKLAQALAASQGKSENMKPLEAVPPSLRGHSSYLLALAQVLRRQDRLDEALAALLRTPRDPAQLADAEEWWTERRVLIRRLLDKGDHASAYRVAAEHGGLGPGRRAEAEFHAGWIALRYLGHAQTALAHFEASAECAELAAAKARAAYWRGRALEAGAHGDGTAEAAYEAAAAIPATYYGQLAAERLGREALHLGVTEASEADETFALASPGGRVIRLLLDADMKEFAQPLAIDFARVAPSASHVDAVADLFVKLGDAPTVLAIGRQATARGFAVEQHAFPTFGVPRYEPLPGSEDKAMVYAIARQESAFNAKAISTADARGLMQMLPSTAARTASRFKVPFSSDRLISDPGYNAMLGAAHLGELMEETKGSVVMAFASYNAGGHRVREWVNAFGDPRRPDVDVVDWVERIPFYETRHYVQKIMENLQAYRARFSDNRSALLIKADMERGRRN